MPPSARHPVARRPQRTAEGDEDVPAQTPKQTQRERLLQAMVELAAKSGYQAVSIAQLSSLARVSSATFYQQFESKDDCFAAAYRDIAGRVLSQMQPVERDTLASDEEWAEAARAAIGRLLSAVQRDPRGGRVLYIESMAGGPEVLEERARVLEAFEQRSRHFLDSTPDGAAFIDLPVPALIGATRTIVSRHLRTNAEDQLTALADDLVTWLRAYRVPPGRTRWSTGPRALLPVKRTLRTRAPGTRETAVERLPRGRHGLPAAVVARSQHTRIMHGTAEVMLAKGYANATVADIVAAAGVSRDVFYEHFTDKHHAFLEAQQHPTQHILDTCAAAYFAADSWPERVWDGLRALIELIVENPALAHLRLVECYAAGPEATRRAEDIARAFSIFLEEGYRQRPQADALQRLCSQAISGAVFEIIRRHVALGESAALVQRLPQLSYIAIAPFTGAVEAIELLEDLRARDPSVSR